MILNITKPSTCITITLGWAAFAMFAQPTSSKDESAIIEITTESSIEKHLLAITIRLNYVLGRLNELFQIFEFKSKLFFNSLSFSDKRLLATFSSSCLHKNSIKTLPRSSRFQKRRKILKIASRKQFYSLWLALTDERQLKMEHTQKKYCSLL